MTSHTQVIVGTSVNPSQLLVSACMWGVT